MSYYARAALPPAPLIDSGARSRSVVHSFRWCHNYHRLKNVPGTLKNHAESAVVYENIISDGSRFLRELRGYPDTYAHRDETRK